MRPAPAVPGHARRMTSGNMPRMQHMTTTAFAIDGYTTVQTLGLVRGIVVRSRSIIGTFGATLQTIVGGNITL